MDTVRYHPRRIDQLADTAPDTPTRWVWPGYLARGNVTLLTGQWKAGKTTFLAGLLRHLGSGEPFLGRPCPLTTSLVVSEEDDAHWIARHRAIPFGPHVRVDTRPFPARPTPHQWDAFVRHAEADRAAAALDLLVLDTLSEFLPGRSDSDPATLRDLLRPLRRFAAGGSAVLVLHHPRKATSEEGSSARGSGALLGFADVIVELHRVGGLASDSCRRRLVGLSRLPDTPRQLVYEWTPGTPDFRLVDDPHLMRFRENWETVRVILAGRKAAATHKELLADWPTDRLPPSPSQLYEWLGRALSEGLVKRTGSGTRNEPFRFRLPPPPPDPNEFVPFADVVIPDLPPLRGLFE